MIKGSVRCFGLGCFALIPVVGIAPALLTLIQFRHVVALSENSWNVANSYLVWGAVLAGVGLVVSLLCLGLIVAGLANYLLV